MKIRNATFYSDDGESKKVYPIDIKDRKDYLDNYAHRLFCSEPECSAEIAFAELQHSKTPKIFKTMRGSEHEESCLFKIDEDKSKRPVKSGEEVQALVSDEHVKSIHKSMRKKRREANGTTPTSIRDVGKKSKRANKGLPTIIRKNYVPATNSDGEPVESGAKEPSVKQRNCNRILQEDIKQFRGIYGDVISAEITENSVKFVFETSNGDRVVASALESFIQISQSAFDNLKFIGEWLNKTNEKLYCSAIGVLSQNDKEISIYIEKPIMLEFNEKPIAQFIANLDV